MCSTLNTWIRGFVFLINCAENLKWRKNQKKLPKWNEQNKYGIEMSFNLLEEWHFNHRLFNHELSNPIVQKFMVEMSKVENCWKVWGWMVWGWDDLQPLSKRENVWKKKLMTTKQPKGPFIHYVITCRGDGGQKMPIFDHFQH